MDANRVAVGIEDHGQAAYRRRHGFHAELHVVRVKVRNGGVKILDFQCGGAAVGAGVPTG